MRHVFVLVLALAVPSLVVAADAKPEPGFITGRVVGPNGDPVRGATVGYAEWGGNVPQTTVTSRDGRFKLGPLPPTAKPRRGIYAEADGLAREFVPAPPVLPSAASDVGDIALNLGQRYFGTVVDENKTPLAGVRVRCELIRNSNRYTVYTIGPDVEGLTNPEGRFELPPLPLGRYSLKYEVVGKATFLANLFVESGPTAEVPQVRMEKETPLVGRVVDEDGKPVAGALIGRREQDGLSGPDGRFVIHGLGGSQMRNGGTFTVEAGGYLSGSVAYPSDDPVVVKLLRPGWFTGLAVDADTGLAVRLDRARVSLPPDKKNAAPRAITTYLEQPETGRFRVQFDAPGEYAVTLLAEGYEAAEFTSPKADARKSIEVPNVKMKKLPADRPVRAVAGTATRGGKAIPTGWATLYRVAPYWGTAAAPMVRNRPVVWDQIVYAEAEMRNGSFQLPATTDAKDWYVAVYEPGRSPTIVGPFAVALGKPTQLEIAATDAGSLSGRVPERPAKWDGHLWVVAFSKSGYRAEVRLGADGKFTFPALPPGDYGLKVGHDMFQDADIEEEAPKAPGWKLQPPADPWKRAKLVTVEQGKAATVAGLILPEK